MPVKLRYFLSGECSSFSPALTDSPLDVGQNCADQGCSPLFATLNQSSADLGIPKRQQALAK